MQENLVTEINQNFFEITEIIENFEFQAPRHTIKVLDYWRVLECLGTIFKVSKFFYFCQMLLINSFRKDVRSHLKNRLMRS